MKHPGIVGGLYGDKKNICNSNNKNKQYLCKVIDIAFRLMSLL